MPQIGEGQKFPLMGYGQAFDRAVIGDATIELVSSGLVGTAYGLPGFSATLIGTGLYDLRYNTTAIRGARFYPHTMPGSPSGPVASSAPVQFGANMAHVGGHSGMALLQTTRIGPQASGIVNALPSGTVNSPANPPTGSVINLLVLGSPVRRY